MRRGAGFPTRLRYAELLARYGRLLLPRPEGGRWGASENAADAAGGERARARRVLEAEGLRADDFRLGRSKACAPPRAAPRRPAPRPAPHRAPRSREETAGVLGGGGGGEGGVGAGGLDAG